MIHSVLQKFGEHDTERGRHGGGQPATIALHLESHGSVDGLQALLGQTQQGTHDFDERNVVARLA